MGETLQKKEWSQRDVQRLRNIYNKQLGAATTTQVGYTSKQVERKEGEIWTEENKQWIMKNGIKTTYSSLQSIRNKLATPMMCPSCSNKMKDALDKKMYTIHKKCFSCVQSYESKLKLEGKYEEYVKNITRANAQTFLKEAREYVSEIEKSGTEYFTADGKKENWVGGDIKIVTDKMNADLDKLEKQIQE
jgi:uncharacterized protein (UPF0248 family)